MARQIRPVVRVLLYLLLDHANNVLWAIVLRHPRSLVFCGLYLRDTRALICFAGYIFVIPMLLVASDGLCCFALVPPVTSCWFWALLIARQDYHDPNRRAYAFALAIASFV